MNWWQSLILQLGMTGMQILNAKYNPKPETIIPTAGGLAAVQAVLHRDTSTKNPDGTPATQPWSK